MGGGFGFCFGFFLQNTTPGGLGGGQKFSPPPTCGQEAMLSFLDFGFDDAARGVANAVP